MPAPILWPGSLEELLTYKNKCSAEDDMFVKRSIPKAAILCASLAAARLPAALQRTGAGRGHCAHCRGPVVHSPLSHPSALGTCCRTRVCSAQPSALGAAKNEGPFQAVAVSRGQRWLWAARAPTEEPGSAKETPTALLRWDA